MAKTPMFFSIRKIFLKLVQGGNRPCGKFSTGLRIGGAVKRGRLDINAIKRSMDQLQEYKEAELIAHQLYKEVEDMLSEESPNIDLTAEDQVILKLITKRFEPATVGKFIDIVEDESGFEHWTDTDREACMRKMQNLGLVRIKTPETMGAVGMREASMRGE